MIPNLGLPGLFPDTCIFVMKYGIKVPALYGGLRLNSISELLKLFLVIVCVTPI